MDHAGDGSRGVLGEMGKKRSRADGVAAEDEEDDRKDSKFGKCCAGEAEVQPRGPKRRRYFTGKHTGVEDRRQRNAAKNAKRRAWKREAAAATDTPTDDLP